MMYDMGNLRISLLRCHVSLRLNLLSGEETSPLDLQRQGAQRALKQALIPSPEKGQHGQMRLWFSETKNKSMTSTDSAFSFNISMVSGHTMYHWK